MVEMFATPEFVKDLPSERVEDIKKMWTDYLFASIWFGVWTIVGCALLYLGWSGLGGGPNDEKLPPAIGR